MSESLPLIELGNNIRKMRKKKKMTMDELSILANIECRQLGRIERAEINTSVLSLIKIAIALDSGINDFFENVLDLAISN